MRTSPVVGGGEKKESREAVWRMPGNINSLALARVQDRAGVKVCNWVLRMTKFTAGLESGFGISIRLCTS